MPRRRYGWIRSAHDERDFHFAASPHVLAALPASVDLEPLWQGRDVYDQGALGSCGPNSAAGDIIAADLPHGIDWLPSRLFIYWTTRYLMGTVNQDSGVDNRTLLKALAQFGFCDESLWPYVIQQFTRKPSDAAFQQAAGRKIDTYLRVPQDINQMKGCLAGGDPFIFGFTCYESLESAETARTGIIPLPGSREKVIGGHDIVFCGYDDAKAMFKLRNSWGKDWGEHGYGWISYEYALNAQLSGDFWTVRYSSAPLPPTPPVPPNPPQPPTPPPPPPPTPAPIDWSKIWTVLKPYGCNLWHAAKPSVMGYVDTLPIGEAAIARIVAARLDTECPL